MRLPVSNRAWAMESLRVDDNHLTGMLKWLNEKTDDDVISPEYYVFRRVVAKLQKDGLICKKGVDLTGSLGRPPELKTLTEKGELFALSVRNALFGLYGIRPDEDRREASPEFMRFVTASEEPPIHVGTCVLEALRIHDQVNAKQISDWIFQATNGQIDFDARMVSLALANLARRDNYCEVVGDKKLERCQIMHRKTESGLTLVERSRDVSLRIYDALGLAA
jgi:hypothetical protein